MIDQELNLSNRRHNKRVALAVPAQNTTSGGQKSQSVTINLSCTGARLVVDRQTAHQPSFDLQLSDQLKLSATTVWSEPLAQGSRYVVGVHFHEVSEVQRWQLLHLMHRHNI